MGYLSAGLRALVSDQIPVGRSASIEVPGSVSIRLSTVFGNRRIHRLMDPYLRPGAVIADVGANIGVNTVYAAQRVGPTGRVIAIEPTPDNLEVLRRNVARNHLPQVTIAPVAAGRAHETREFFIRGDVSAVNSFYQESVYAAVTEVVPVTVAPLDDLVDGDADLVKIDVEGAELDVLGGMTRLLRSPRLVIVAEWHPLLQEKGGFAADALPLTLLDLGFALQGASHTQVRPVGREQIPGLIAELRRSGSPVDLLATR